MESEHLNDPYAPGSKPPGDAIFDIESALRIVVACMGVFLIVGGFAFSYGAFDTIRDIITTPDTLVSTLDAWTQEELEAAPKVAEPVREAVEATEPEEAETPEELPALEDPETPAQLPNPAAQPLPSAQGGQNRALENQNHAESMDKANGSGAFWRELLDLIRDGGLSRVLSAFIIFLFAVILVRIPIEIMKVGVKLVLAPIEAKPKKK